MRLTPEDSFKARLVNNERRAWLRPMGTGEMIDTALRLYQRSAWSILKLTAVPMVLCYAAVVFIDAVVWPSLFSRTGRSTGSDPVDIALALLIGLLVATPLFFLGLGWAGGVIVSVVRSILHGIQPDEKEASSMGWRAMGPVAIALGSTLLASLIGALLAGSLVLMGVALEGAMPGLGWGILTSLFGVFAVVVAGVTIPIVWHTRALVPVLAVIEGLGARAAAKRSRSLMKSYRGHPSSESLTMSVFFLMLLVALPLMGSLEAVIELTRIQVTLAQWNPLPGVGQMLSMLVGGLPAYLTLWLLSPLWTTATTVLYYDRIVRFEAYDVTLMLEDINQQKRRSVLLR